MLQVVPELVGVYEARKMLNNVSNQYISQLVKEGKIVPCQRLRCGSIFLKSEIERFKELKDNKKQNQDNK